MLRGEFFTDSIHGCRGTIASVDPLFDERLGYHAIRRVARPESPFAGVLARDDTGVTALLVEVGGVGGWPARLMHRSSEHMLAPVDVVAGGSVAEIVLPWCSERVDAFLARRRRAGQPLGAGEAVTLGVCILRGAHDLLEPDGGVGSWWLTSQGRPVFAPGADAGEARGAAVASDPRGAADSVAQASVSGAGAHIAALKALGAACRDRGIEAAILLCAGRLAEAVATESRDRAPGRWNASITSTLAEGEESLFALASAEPLDTSSLRPRPARSLQGEFDALLDDPGGVIDTEAERPPRRFWRVWGFVRDQVRQAGARHVDPEIADVAADTWRRTRGGAGRVLRRPLVVGAVLMVLIVGVGVLWPDDGGGGGEPAGAGPRAATSPADRAAAPGAGAATDPATSGGDAAAPPGESVPGDPAATTGLASLADGLLVSRAACQYGAACAAAVYEDDAAAQRVRPAAGGASGGRPIDAAPRARELTLVDDLGGVAVVRVSLRSQPAVGRAAEMLIIVQTDRGWRIRDVFDVLDAPPAGERE